MEQVNEKNKAVFDAWAREGRDMEMERLHMHAVREALRDVALPEDAAILDVGCGNGYVVRALAHRLSEATVMGIDSSGEMIFQARDLTPDETYNAIFVQGTIFDEMLDTERFDLIFAMESIYYMDIPRALARLRGLLKPDGKLIVVVDYYKENKACHGWPKKYGLDMQLLSEAEYRQAFTEASLNNVNQRHILYPEGGDFEEWKVKLGSLVTSGDNVTTFSPEDIFHKDTEAESGKLSRERADSIFMDGK